MFCLWLEDAPLSQWTSAAGSLSLNFLTIKLLSVVIMQGLPSQVELLHTTSAPNRANAKEMSVRQWGTALNLNPDGTPFSILNMLSEYEELSEVVFTHLILHKLLRMFSGKLFLFPSVVSTTSANPCSC